MRVLELFAGYGSQSLALKRLGISHISDISEIDKYAIDTYNQIHGETFNYGDISKIDKLNHKYDLMTYSFPCQDISNAGKRRGLSRDSGTRSSLLWEVERLIDLHNPDYLLMENVEALIDVNNKPNYLEWLRVLDSKGYRNFWQVMNSKDYGVPQSRDRVFCVSIKKELNQGFVFEEPRKLNKFLIDILEKDVDDKYYLDESSADPLLACLCVPGDNNKTKEINQLGNFIITKRFGGDPQDGRVYGVNGISPCLNTRGVCHIAIKSNTKKGYDVCYNGDGVNLSQPTSKTRRGRVSQRITQTLTTKCDQGVNIQGKIRRLTPREYWRLMGVDDADFDKIKGISNSQLYKMAGNSIVVDVLESIFKGLFVNKINFNEMKGQIDLFDNGAE